MNLDDTDDPPVDLTGAEVYAEADRQPIAGGRWYIPRPEVVPADHPDFVVYQRPNGKYSYRSMVTAHDLRTKSAWRRLDSEPTE